MAKIKILGTAAVLVSDVKTSTLETLKKYKPAALKLIDPETRDESFAVTTGKTSSISKHGVCFTNTNEDGYAEVTIELPVAIENNEKKQYVADNYGYTLLNLNSIERQITKAMSKTEHEFVAINDSIEAL